MEKYKKIEDGSTRLTAGGFGAIGAAALSGIGRQNKLVKGSVSSENGDHDRKTNEEQVIIVLFVSLKYVFKIF